ncbi:MULTISPECIES: carboxylating nicotinate-nucleotide diphosphorylase [unclassified Marinobacterium]|jgi:nicotinate-nucleotide pyrophosphorylase (carboxylating)|uniref:carboxylating nicotinate-nucleotide diphosphorylase n=1 Tax=unclassified Marinobacterium TaxID=2644139 RepID=UPI001568E92A|nr:MULTISPECIES: carboxylating nicotinate-nucleotide diphosphorylase [unclassified Marinobacterium]NRP52866.1 Nicotinate-nucleotide pyrophosphorylase [carboxylating] [Marinobacterium sp. xm-v-242]NRP77447.1 Nicotinate-nucleotide pyrophosphorylase [carboxylating] [Marinobacterium sp. xm-m-383]
MLTLETLKPTIEANVRLAIEEDVSTGDITAELIPESQQANAEIISRDQAVIAGSAWVNEVFKQVDPTVEVDWKVADGDSVAPNTLLFTLKGSARSLLTGERAALNFLQTLSGTATLAKQYSDKVANTPVKLLDTRKTLPGLRLAQKYAVTCGGCYNHRIGLFDAFLIKENHILAAGGIESAISQAKSNHPGKPVEVEVESFDELNQALEAGADIIMLDNFTPDQMREAVALVDGRAKLEASGNITDDTLVSYAETGVDYISIGALTKHCRAIDLSMRLV